MAIAWINNKVLLCSTGNYIQYPVISMVVFYTAVINTNIVNQLYIS